MLQGATGLNWSSCENYENWEEALRQVVAASVAKEAKGVPVVGKIIDISFNAPGAAPDSMSEIGNF